MHIRIREAGPDDAEGIAHVHVTTWQAAYQGIVPADFLASLNVPQRAERWRQNLSQPDRAMFLLIAQTAEGRTSAEGPRTVGFAAAGPERTGDSVYKSEVYALYVLPEYHGHGIGRELVRACVARMTQDGDGALLIWVLADNPSRGFYEAMGGQPVRQQIIEIGGVPLAEVGYGWPSMRALLS